MPEPHVEAGHFDAAHAAEYGKNTHITFPGYEACHELAACMMVASLGSGGPKRILVVGAGGTALEIINLARLEPGWRYVGVDQSQPMLDAAKDRLEQVGLAEGADLRIGTVLDLPADERFDGAVMIGVLHHIMGAEAKAATLTAIADRLKPGGAFVLADNFTSHSANPLLLKAWSERRRLYGDTHEEAHEKASEIDEMTHPAESEGELFAMLAEAGFKKPLQFFTSLTWGAWVIGKG